MGIAREYLTQQIPQIKRQENTAKIGINGFTAYVSFSESEDYQSDAPDIPLEDGSISSDHIIKKPLILNVVGEVANVYYEEAPPLPLLPEIRQAQAIISPYLPTRTQATVQRIAAAAISVNDAINAIDATIEQGAAIGDIFGSGASDSEKNIDVFLANLRAVYENKSPITIETSGGVFDNMAMIGLTINRDNTSNDFVSFSLTLKKINFVKVGFSALQANYSAPSAITGGKTEGEKDKGAANTEEERNQSILFRIFN